MDEAFEVTASCRNTHEFVLTVADADVPAAGVTIEIWLEVLMLTLVPPKARILSTDVGTEAILNQVLTATRTPTAAVTDQNTYPAVEPVG